MNKSLSLPLIGLFSLVLTACGGGGGGGDNDDAPVMPTENTGLFTGEFTMDISGFTIEEENQLDVNASGAQLSLLIANTNTNVFCSASYQFFPVEIGLQPAIAQLTENSLNAGTDILSSTSIAAPNGEAGEIVYSLTITTDAGAVSFTGIEHVYYFAAVETSYSRATLVNYSCLTPTFAFATNEAEIRRVLDSVEFLREGAAADLPWFEIPMGDVISSGADQTLSTDILGISSYNRGVQ